MSDASPAVLPQLSVPFHAFRLPSRPLHGCSSSDFSAHGGDLLAEKLAVVNFDYNALFAYGLVFGQERFTLDVEFCQYTNWTTSGFFFGFRPGRDGATCQALVLEPIRPNYRLSQQRLQFANSHGRTVVSATVVNEYSPFASANEPKPHHLVVREIDGGRLRVNWDGAELGAPPGEKPVDPRDFRGLFGIYQAGGATTFRRFTFTGGFPLLIGLDLENAAPEMFARLLSEDVELPPPGGGTLQVSKPTFNGFAKVKNATDDGTGTLRGPVCVTGTAFSNSGGPPTGVSVVIYDVGLASGSTPAYHKNATISGNDWAIDLYYHADDSGVRAGADMGTAKNNVLYAKANFSIGDAKVSDHGFKGYYFLDHTDCA